MINVQFLLGDWRMKIERLIMVDLTIIVILMSIDVF